MVEITKKEFLELLQEFSEKTLDPKFEKIDERFEKVDGRLEKIEERFGKIDLQFAEVNSRFDELKKDIIDQFHVISEDVISKVQIVAEGIINLDEKINRRMDAFEKKNEEQHQDLLAAVKFSYAELDRRITTLESEVKDLRTRMDKIERRSVS